MHDILILTEPVELVECKITQCTISYLTEQWVGMLKSQQMHDILISLNQWSCGNAKITTQMHDILILTEPSWWEC
jgi:hypothetical protein